MIGRRVAARRAASLADSTPAGCATNGADLEPETVRIPDDVLAMYAARPDERFPIPAARIDLIEPQYWRQMRCRSDRRAARDGGGRYGQPLPLPGAGERPGAALRRRHRPRRLHLVGAGVIQFKREWPTWTPPSEMIARQPELEPYRTGMPPSLENPLGARALYIFKDGRDTIYRLHGATDERTIGKAISSGWRAAAEPGRDRPVSAGAEWVADIGDLEAAHWMSSATESRDPSFHPGAGRSARSALLRFRWSSPRHAAGGSRIRRCTHPLSAWASELSWT